MSNRGLRFVIALLALVAAGAAGLRIYQQEQRLAEDVAAARAVDAAAESAIVTVSELKAALHAYVAAGQGHAFWTTRAAGLLDKLRGSVLELDGAATAAGVPLTETLDLTDRLEVAEERAREHVRASQELLAGEVIFTEARDLLDAIRLHVVRARTETAHAAAVRQADLRGQQTMLGLGAAGVLAFAMLLLVLPGRAVAPEAPPVQRGAPEPPDEFESSARIISREPIPAAPAAGTDSRAATAAASAASTPARALPAPAAAPARPASGVRPAAPAAAASGTTERPRTAAGAAARPPATLPAASLKEAAAVCTDFARVSQSAQITGLLARAAKVLDATGVVVWMASDDSSRLFPAASAGYDERLLARIGSVPRDSANVTAAAYRAGTPKTSARGSSSAAAIAVPLLTPQGPAGVLSAEIRNIAEVDDTRLSLATIFAAQLATLVAAISAPAAESAPSENDQAPPATAKA